MEIYRNLNNISIREKIEFKSFYDWMNNEFDLKFIMKQCGFRKESDLIRSIEFACKYF
jgi:hypothetical protein